MHLSKQTEFSYNQGFQDENVHKTGLPIHSNFLYFSLTFIHLDPLQVENRDSNSRLVVDKDDNVKSGVRELTMSGTNRELTHPTRDRLYMSEPDVSGHQILTYNNIFIYFSDIHSTMSNQNWLTNNSKYNNISAGIGDSASLQTLDVRPTPAQ